MLSSHEDPSLSSCCGEISRPLSRLPSYWNTQAALSESTVLGAAMAAGNAIVLPPVFKAGDCSLHSPGSSGWPGSQAKAGRTAFVLRTRAGLCFGAVGTAIHGRGCVCVLVCVCRGGGRFHLCIFAFEFPFMFARSLNNNAPSPTLFWAQGQMLRGWFWLAPSRRRFGLAHTGPCPPHSLSVS